jgi:hypothetical protein
MTTTQRITFTGSQRPVKGATATPIQSVTLTGIDAKSNAQRLAEYTARRDNLRFVA